MNQPWIYIYSPSQSPLPPRSPPIPLGLPSAPGPSTCLMHPTRVVICFTLDNIHVSKLFSRNIPPLTSPTESQSLFCTSVSLFLLVFIFLTYFTLYNGLQFCKAQPYCFFAVAAPIYICTNSVESFSFLSRDYWDLYVRTLPVYTFKESNVSFHIMGCG